MVNLPPGILPLVEARARSQNRSVANYLETIATEDVNAKKSEILEYLARESQAPYQTSGDINVAVIPERTKERSQRSSSSRKPRKAG